ncbi:dTDP-4-dehydrorhamnose reductase [Rubinisphaera brasiliensis]|uniref:dTDP-4-dehydrorhamnose reductase n=1 Tax=Rubinisphaera brasiliensis (strain ATCC 49424 / DSM 5305 / JCM 21570 / IAM 15109 / NBRC 103401 / IFAM 1448) TaxID=756272 RepID=F0SP04_RUBBR|nr:dTDP-4-dehydrorhamnose reductase [Rubinisphaera brasiliensis]ADY60080.1 dTDP-4-dehydrorhamnose reductase [Rubinisphaera brasiliensis DSM 5305]
MPATLILGVRGQLGTALHARMPQAIGLGRAELNVDDLDNLAHTLDEHQPQQIINCTAWNQVDLAETETAAAFHTNALVPRALARYCQQRECRLVHVSTDYVFGGNANPGRGWTEDDRPIPSSVYGSSKLAGENFVLTECPAAQVIRTCGLYGFGGNGNFVTTMLKLARAGRSLKVVDDQICTPTLVEDLAVAIEALLASSEPGLFHVTNRGHSSWFEFAQQIFSLADVQADLSPVSSAEYGAAARRPAWSVLDCSRFERVTGQTLPTLDDALGRFLSEHDTVD